MNLASARAVLRMDLAADAHALAAGAIRRLGCFAKVQGTAVLAALSSVGLPVAVALTGSAAALGAQAHGAEVLELPLRTHAGRMYVPVQAPGGAELHFLLSTGSPVAVLSESGARRLGDGGAPTLGGHLPVSMDGSQTVPDASLTIDGKVFDGLLGSNTLSTTDMLVDVPNGRLLLRRPGTSGAWPGEALSDPVPLRIFHGVVLSLDVALNDVEYPAMLELGTPGVGVNERVITEAGIEGGAGTLRLAGATLTGVPVSVSDHPAIGRFSPNGDGFVLVGAALAMDCAVAVSWTHAELRTCVR